MICGHSQFERCWLLMWYPIFILAGRLTMESYFLWTFSLLQVLKLVFYVVWFFDQKFHFLPFFNVFRLWKVYLTVLTLLCGISFKKCLFLVIFFQTQYVRHSSHKLSQNAFELSNVVSFDEYIQILNIFPDILL